jgi:putative transposase
MFHHRKSLRLKDYNYASAGAYFVTICSEHRAHLFGEIENLKMRLNPAGQMIESTWNESPTHLNVSLDALVVMPNHLHGIVVLDSHTQNLSDVIKRFKTLSTKRFIDGVKEHGWPAFAQRVWQRQFL